MKICLIRGPSIVARTAFIAPLAPPIGLAYLAGSLRFSGHQVYIIDGVGENPLNSIPYSGFLVLRGLDIQDIVDLVHKDTDLIGISEMFSSQWTITRRLIDSLGKVFPYTFMIGGGEHFTAAPELSLKQCPDLDACVIGEGEETVIALSNALERGDDIKNISGIVLRSETGFIKTSTRPRIRAIDEISAPAWDLIPLTNYLDEHLGFGVDRGRSMPMLASRGCPYQCTFCSNLAMWDSYWVCRDPKMVVDEIEHYVKTYQIDNVDFYDLTAIVKRNWIVEFCNELINRKVNISWQLPSGTRSEAIDREVSKLLYQSGCRNLSYAPESGSEATLMRIKKKIKLDRLEKSIVCAIKENLNVKVNIIIGFPDEIHRDILKTFWLIVKMSWYGAQDVGVARFSPYPGSELYSRLVSEGRIDHSDEFFDTLPNVTFKKTVSYCNNISDRWLRFYNVTGFLLFYITNYFFRPWRFVRTIHNIIYNQHQSRGEMALSHLLDRLWSN